MLTPFPLPSDPDTTIRMAEATVRDALAFCDTNPDNDEALISEFLNRVQIPEHYDDSRGWTGDDRRFALFWYAVHTLKDTRVRVPYECPHCKDPHTHVFDLRDLADSYQTVKGKAFRLAKFKGREFQVYPHNGETLEALEALRLELSGKPESRTLAEIKIHELARWINQDGEVFGIEDLMRLSVSDFKELQDLVKQAIEDMAHGLRSVTIDGQLMLVSPEHKCPAAKTMEAGGEDREEVATVLHLPFRDFARVPEI